MMKPARSKNRVLCLWLPQWPLQRLRLVRPELKYRELILFASQRSCLRVVCSSKHGIPLGLPLAEAKTLVAAHFEQHDPLADKAALLKLAAACEEFSPVVGIEPPDNLCFDITGIGQLFGSEHTLAGQIVRFLQRHCFVANVAVADTLGAAWAVAHFGREFPAVIPPGQTVKALADLPVAALRLDATDILTELGIQRNGQLLTLPRDALASRFDPQLLWRLDQATGLVPEPILSHRTPPDITAETQLEYAIEDRRAVDLIVGELVERVAAVLVQRQQGAIQLECLLPCEDKEIVRVVVGLYRASAHAKHLLELTRLQLDRVTLPAPVVAVRLSVLTAVPLQSWQQELFEPSRRENRRQVGLLVDRLSNRLGRDAVVRAVPQAEAQPEMAFRYEPLAGVLPRKTKEQRWKKLPRPLRLEQEPIPLEVMSVVPDGPPMQFQHEDGTHRVAYAWGPERIQTGWWRGRYVQRDYYRVETSSGRRFWLFLRLSDGKWFLHGVFD